jgi:hypothetical protein
MSRARCAADRVEFSTPLWQIAGERRYALYVTTGPGAEGVLAPAGRTGRWGLSRQTPLGAPGWQGLTARRLLA